MTIVGRVESLWRYPVKSMRGEELPAAFVGFSGVYGDRLYAFHSAAAREGFPFLTGREQERMLLYCPAYRNSKQMTKPPNLEQAEALPPGLTPARMMAKPESTRPCSSRAWSGQVMKSLY